MFFASSVIGILLVAFLPQVAYAISLPDVIDRVVGNAPLISNIALPSGSMVQCPAGLGGGACAIANALIYSVHQVRLLAAAVAFIVLVVAGFRLVIGQTEESMATARRAVLGAVIGLFVIYIIEPVVDAFYGGFSIAPASRLIDSATAQQGAIILSSELMGILSWIETIVAIVAVGLIVVQAVGVLASFGSEEQIKKIYRAVVSTVFGILLIIFDVTIANIFGLSPEADIPTTPTTLPFFVEAFGLVRFVLLFMAIITVAILVYAGFLMLLNFGHDELVNRGKKIFANALIGLLLIIVSFVIVSTIILGL